MEPVIIEVPAGAEIPVPREGDFIFVIDCGHTLDVLLGSQGRALAEPGAMIRPAQRFPNFHIRNPDPERPAFVRMIVGEGSYTSQIIQGEVTVNPGIKGEDGQFVDDTRSTIRLRAAFGNITPREYVEGEVVREVDGGSSSLATILADGRRVLVCDYSGGNWHLNRDYPGGEWEPILAPLGDAVGEQSGQEVWFPAGENLPGIGGRIVLNVYDAATLEFRRKVVTDAVWAGSGGNPQIRGLIHLPGSRVAVTHKGEAEVITSIISKDDGAVVKRLEPDLSTSGLALRNGVIHLINGGIGSGSGSGSQFYDAVTYEQLPDSANQFPDDGVFVYSLSMGPKDTVLIGTSSTIIRELALRDVTISASGTVSACAGSGRLKAQQVDTVAQLYTQRLENGRVLASGELLKAALELYTGRYMPADYLDYIYGVRADNLDGISPRIISTGGQSFKAAGVADDAAGTFPQTIEITLREGLL